jgi:hypothetical protein
VAARGGAEPVTVRASQQGREGTAPGSCGLERPLRLQAARAAGRPALARRRLAREEGAHLADDGLERRAGRDPEAEVVARPVDDEKDSRSPRSAAMQSSPSPNVAATAAAWVTAR